MKKTSAKNACICSLCSSYDDETIFIEAFIGIVCEMKPDITLGTYTCKMEKYIEIVCWKREAYHLS